MHPLNTFHAAISALGKLPLSPIVFRQQQTEHQMMIKFRLPDNTAEEDPLTKFKPKITFNMNSEWCYTPLVNSEVMVA